MVYAMAEQLSGAIVSGLGETVTPIKLKQTLDMVLIFPPFGCPTGAVYRAFDQQLNNPTKQADLSLVQQLANKQPLNPADPFNDLAHPACLVQPDLASLQKQIADALNQPVHITGSGSTMYLICKDTAHANDLAKQIRDQFQLKTVATQTI
mgnify:FL=1